MTYLLVTLILGMSFLFYQVTLLGKERKLLLGEVASLTDDNSKILSQKKSSEVRLGQIGEHFAPFLTEFPYNPKDVRFLGSPIDLIAFDFDSNKLVFIEFKTGNSKQSARQRSVRRMVESGNVFYEIIRVNKGVSSKMSGMRLTEESRSQTEEVVEAVVEPVSPEEPEKVEPVAEEPEEAVEVTQEPVVEPEPVVAEDNDLKAVVKPRKKKNG